MYICKQNFLLKKIISLIFILILCYAKILAQDDILINKFRNVTLLKVEKVADSLDWNWKQGGSSTFSLNQSSISNWAAGGNDFSLSFNAYFNYYLFYKKDKQNWDNNFDYNIGYIQSSNNGSKKNDDRIEFISKYGYKIDTTGKWFLTGLFSFRTQLFDGYVYSGNNPIFSSSFLSPAYTILSIGMDNKVNDKLSLFYSPLTARWTLVLNNYLANLGKYGVNANTNTNSEVGVFFTINLRTVIAQNIQYKGRLDLFSNYNNHPENINLFMTNFFKFVINKKFQTNINIDFIYDDKVKQFGPNNNSPALQFRSGIGIAYSFPIKIKYK